MTSSAESGDLSYAPPQDTGAPDAVERDPAALSSAEDLDEDRLRLDPLEAGMDPPDNWTGADKYGMTPYEQATPRPLTDRLAEEQPDVDAQDEPAADGVAGDQPREPLTSLRDEALREAVTRGQAADEARGTAEGIPDKEI